MIDLANKYGGTIVLYVVYILFAGVLAYEAVTGQNLNSYLLAYIGAVSLQATYSGGVTHGVVSTNDTVNKTAIAQYPLTPAGIAGTEQVQPTTH
jgi:hypothetical protein